MKREVVIVRQQPVSLFGVFFVVVLFLMFWKWVLVVVGSIAAAVLVYYLAKAMHQRQREQDELEKQIRDRADRQLNWYMSGDPRGLYGEDWDDEGLQR